MNARIEVERGGEGEVEKTANTKFIKLITYGFSVQLRIILIKLD